MAKDTTKLTKRSAELFRLYAEDAANWSGMPLVGGNIGGSKADRGNLTHLKRAGLITTSIDEGNTWISFTAAGHAYACELGITDLGIHTISLTPTVTVTEGTKENTMPKAAKKTATKTATKAVTAKTAPAKAAAKTAAPVPAKTVPATKLAGLHAFISSAAEPLKCVTCGEAPSGKRHRRHMDTMRRMWRNGSLEERMGFLTHIEDGNPAEAKLTWTALPAFTKRSLTACLPDTL
jgi:hypothetical protein